MLTTTCTHEGPCRLSDTYTPFFASVAAQGGEYQNPRGSNYNPLAHGNIVHIETCTACGAERQVAINGRHRESGPWTAPRAVREAREREAQQEAQLARRAAAGRQLSDRGVQVLGWAREDVVAVEIGGVRKEIALWKIKQAAGPEQSDDDLRGVYAAMLIVLEAM